jgi:hypothetical protein
MRPPSSRGAAAAQCVFKDTVQVALDQLGTYHLDTLRGVAVYGSRG